MQKKHKITMQKSDIFADFILSRKAKGVKIGRPKTTTDNIPSVFFRHYPSFKSGQLNLSEFARVCNLSRVTIYKYLELLE